MGESKMSPPTSRIFWDHIHAEKTGGLHIFANILENVLETVATKI